MRLLAAALLLILSVPGWTTPCDFSFKDVEVQNVASTIAVLGKFNVLVDPALGRLKVTLSLKQVEPLDAMADLARQVGAQVSRVRHEEGTTTVTYMFGRQDDVSRQSKYTRTIQLRYAAAATVSRALGQRIEAITGHPVSTDDRTNRLILTGTDDTFSKVTDLIRDLDLPVPSADVKLTIAAGAPGKTLPVWTGAAVCSQGKVARLHVGVSGGLKAPSWKLLSLEGKVLIRVNSDDFTGVGMNITAALEKDGVKHSVHWATEVQVQSGCDVLVGTVEVAPGEVITLNVSPVIQKSQVPEPEPICGGDDLDQPPQPAPSAKPGTNDLDLEGI